MRRHQSRASAALLHAYDESVSNIENQCILLKCQCFSAKKTPVSPLNDGKTERSLFTFELVCWARRLLLVSNRRCSLLHLSCDMCAPETLLAVIEILFYLFIFLSAAVISGYTVQMNLRLPLWSIMQCHFFRGLLMRSSASFGSTMEIISLFFCLKGNAVLLIKPGCKLVLQLSVEKRSRAMEPSKCQWIITE